MSQLILNTKMAFLHGRVFLQIRLPSHNNTAPVTIFSPHELTIKNKMPICVAGQEMNMVQCKTTQKFLTEVLESFSLANETHLERSEKRKRRFVTHRVNLIWSF